MIIPNGYAQVNFIFGGQAAPTGAQVTLGLDVSAFSGDPEDVAQAVTGAWSTNILVLQSNDIILEAVLAKFGPTATGPSFLRPYGLPGTGGSGAEVPNSAVIVRKQTSFGGRAGRGRMFIPGPDDGLFGPGGEMGPTDQTSWQTAVDDFGADLATALLTPVLLHGEDSPLNTPTEIISFDVEQRAGTQRRRLRR